MPQSDYYEFDGVAVALETFDRIMDLTITNTKPSVTVHVLKTLFKGMVNHELLALNHPFNAQDVISVINSTLDALSISNSLLPLTLALGP